MIYYAPQARQRISDEAIERFHVINKRPTDVEKDHLAIECNITLAPKRMCNDSVRCKTSIFIDSLSIYISNN
ncbi:unnamed protein product [Rotaria sordida]|uniref:Uncharacterized protein n=1 Tax=Rotaria sordida TaxID=392033 RepID=A0A814NGG9_9BILA|nr:unnamed protein product [Rotaria sordida]CAF1091920.1 unnamed protein product [Rotaria sordida]CAF1093509.1 unnamed protein product [Rotaria sordida]